MIGKHQRHIQHCRFIKTARCSGWWKMKTNMYFFTLLTLLWQAANGTDVASRSDRIIKIKKLLAHTGSSQLQATNVQPVRLPSLPSNSEKPWQASVFCSSPLISVTSALLTPVCIPVLVSNLNWTSMKTSLNIRIKTCFFILQTCFSISFLVFSCGDSLCPLLACRPHWGGWGPRPGINIDFILDIYFKSRTESKSENKGWFLPDAERRAGYQL